MSYTTRYPWGEADVQTPAYAATIAVTVKNSMTILNFAQLTGDATLNLTIDAELPVGAILQAKVPAQTDGFDLTLGTGIDGPAIVGVTGKTKTQGFIYDGTSFKPTGTAVQID